MHVPQITAQTRLIALLGDPVAHSVSPAMQNAAFAACELDYLYVALRVAPADLQPALRGLAALGFSGANITVPHKQTAVPFVDDLHEDAAVIGAVNTVVVAGSRLIGHNTDALGFSAALSDLAPEGLAGQSVLLLGAGGAARAIVLALTRLGIGRLLIANRSEGRAEELAALAARLAPSIQCGARDLSQLAAADVRAARLIVNATTMGMDRTGGSERAMQTRLGVAGTEDLAGVGKVPRVLVDNLAVDQIVYDVVYGSRPTELVSAALAAGARAADGTGMLVRQGALAFELWTGRPAPIEEMRRAIER